MYMYVYIHKTHDIHIHKTYICRMYIRHVHNPYVRNKVYMTCTLVYFSHTCPHRWTYVMDIRIVYMAYVHGTSTQVYMSCTLCFVWTYVMVICPLHMAIFMNVWTWTYELCTCHLTCMYDMTHSHKSYMNIELARISSDMHVWHDAFTHIRHVYMTCTQVIGPLVVWPFSWMCENGHMSCVHVITHACMTWLIHTHWTSQQVYETLSHRYVYCVWRDIRQSLIDFWHGLPKCVNVRRYRCLLDNAHVLSTCHLTRVMRVWTDIGHVF